MGAPPGQHAWSPRFATVVATCDTILGNAFRGYDRAALRQQRFHRWIVRIAAPIGALAVVVSIVELALGAELQAVEVVATVFALIAVVLGIGVAFQHEWLLNRYKAERLRGLKFRYLLSPASWSREVSVVESHTEELKLFAEEIGRAEFHDVENWIEAMDVQEPPDLPGDIAPVEDVLEDLKAYYGLMRLGDQGWYYYLSANQNDRWDRYTRPLPQLAFFGSILATLVHFVLKWSGLEDDIGLPFVGLPPATGNTALTLSSMLVILAAALPVVGSCIRTMRGSREFARNRLRYRALLQRLVQAETRIQESRSPDRLLRELWHEEDALEAELREWLRLMVEAEWYG